MKKTKSEQQLPDESTVTVVIPYSEMYTPRSMLDEAIESVEKQEKVGTEILVIEDDEENGPAWARNVGLDHADTRYVAFLDADDLWFKTKLLNQLSEMTETGAGLCVDGETEYSPVAFIGALLTDETFGLTSSILVDTAQTDVQFDESLERREDHLYMIGVAADAGVCFVPKTFESRDHDESLSQHVDTSPKQIDTFFRKVLDRAPEARKFRRKYYQTSYVYLGRSRHFDREYGAAIRYFVESLRHGPNIDAVGAIGLTILAMSRYYSVQSVRHVFSGGVNE